MKKGYQYLRDIKNLSLSFYVALLPVIHSLTIISRFHHTQKELVMRVVCCYSICSLLLLEDRILCIRCVRLFKTVLYSLSHYAQSKACFTTCMFTPIITSTTKPELMSTSHWRTTSHMITTSILLNWIFTVWTGLGILTQPL